MNAELLLKCDGRQDDGFVFCNGVENVILDLSTITAKEKYLELLDYLDKTAKLFNEPSFKNNIIMNTIYKIYELEFMSEKKYKHICYYYNIHKICGLCILIKPKGVNK